MQVYALSKSFQKGSCCSLVINAVVSMLIMSGAYNNKHALERGISAGCYLLLLTGVTNLGIARAVAKFNLVQPNRRSAWYLGLLSQCLLASSVGGVAASQFETSNEALFAGLMFQALGFFSLNLVFVLACAAKSMMCGDNEHRLLVPQVPPSPHSDAASSVSMTDPDDDTEARLGLV